MHRIFGRRAVAALTIAAILTAGSTASAIAQSASLYGINLVTNGGAEADVGAPDSSHVVKPTGWTTTGQFTAVQYGASGGFPDTTSPGPADRGRTTSRRQRRQFDGHAVHLTCSDRCRHQFGIRALHV